MQTQAQQAVVQVSDNPVPTMQILVIDDSETDRTRILRLCKDAGIRFDATEVATIADLKTALESKCFDLVFIDYLLAGEDGLQAIDVLNDHPEQHLASIMIAGEGQIGIAVEAMRRGCSDYLTKPELTVPALQKSIATAIERRMMSMTIESERAMRHSLERSIRQYVNNCSAEMRTMLTASLRRVRKLRGQDFDAEGAYEIGALEDTIDRLWDVLPAFGEATQSALEQSGSEESAKVALLRTF